MLVKLYYYTFYWEALKDSWGTLDPTLGATVLEDQFPAVYSWVRELKLQGLKRLLYKAIILQLFIT